MLSFWGPEAKGLEEEGLLPLMGPALAFTERYQCWICRGSLLGGPWVVSGGFRAHPHAFCFKSLGWGKVGREQSAGAPAGGLLAASGETGRPGLQLTILSLASESDGNPTTEDESSRSPEDLERGAAPVLAEAPAQGSIFLAGAAPPAPCPASSSILVNGSFLAAGSSPAVLLNGSPVIINSLALGEASSLGPLLLTGGSGAPPPPQPAPQGASEGKTSLVLDPQTGEVRLEEAQPNAEDAAETKEAQVAASGTAGEEAAGPLPQVVPGPPTGRPLSSAPRTGALCGFSAGGAPFPTPWVPCRPGPHIPTAEPAPGGAHLAGGDPAPGSGAAAAVSRWARQPREGGSRRGPCQRTPDKLRGGRDGPAAALGHCPRYLPPCWGLSDGGRLGGWAVHPWHNPNLQSQSAQATQTQPPSRSSPTPISLRALGSARFTPHLAHLIPTGNFLLANPVSGSPIVTGVAVQQGKIILTATFPTSMLVSQVLPPAPSLALPLKPDPAISVPEGALPVAPSPALSDVHALGPLSAPQPPPPSVPAATAATSLPFSPDSSGLLPGFPAPPPEGLMLSPAAMPIWPAGLELSTGPEGLLEAEKGLGTQASHTVLRLPDPDPEGLLLESTAGGEADEGLEAEPKVLTQLQSVPVEEPLEL